MKSLAGTARILIVVLSSGLTAAWAATPDPILRGPVFSGTIRSKFPANNTALKGIVVTVGANTNAFVCYDTDLMRVSVGWSGGFLEFDNHGDTQIQHPQPPKVAGAPAFGTKPGPGWANDGTFADPRLKHMGPLPKSWAHYRGLYVNGRNVVLSYTVGDCSVLEMPGLEGDSAHPIFSRTIEVGPSAKSQTLLVAENELGQIDSPRGGRPQIGDTNRSSVALSDGPNGKNVIAIVVGAPAGSKLMTADLRVILELPPREKSTTFKILTWAALREDSAEYAAAVKSSPAPIALTPLCQGGPAQMATTVVNHGVLGTGEGPYVVDTLPEPLPNPWNSKTFFGGFDFFPDGRAAICTFHGDVWIVSGINDSMETLTWRRFATGLFQPLGLKIVDGLIYVTCRDQLTRLHDLNGDGEADFYENFNNDTVVTANYHEFCMDLQTDRAGNFFYAKGSPWTPEVTTPHQGTLLKVSKDGSSLEVYATGLRAPNGMTIGPNDEIMVSDNQGHWMPSSKVNLIKKGGFYGMMPAAHRELTLRGKDGEMTLDPSDPEVRRLKRIAGWDNAAPIPTAYDQPIAWLPYGMDNSSGGQVYVTSDQWGPLKGLPLFMSYGKCTLFLMLPENVDGVDQAGMVQFPLKFQSGLMRGRFNPRDGQLYVSGLRGWQTSATKDGGFYRVRYTGKPVRMPIRLHAANNGLQITFSVPLDASSATDAANWNVDQWNYLYSGNYGSAEFSVKDPKAKGHDTVAIKSVRLSADQKTVFLETDELVPVMQMKVKFAIQAADGSPIHQEIYNTIHHPAAPVRVN